MFQGRELDVETGTMHFRNRQYSAAQGRFLQRDPLGYVDGMGLYEAMGGGPNNSKDPLGLAEVDDHPSLSEGMKDATQIINQYVRRMIIDAVCSVEKAKNLNQDLYKNMEDWEIAMELMVRSTGAYQPVNGLGALWRFGAEMSFSEAALGYMKYVDRKDTKYKYATTGMYWNWTDSLNIIKVGEHTIGVDKIGHFLVEGATYYYTAHYKDDGSISSKPLYPIEYIEAMGRWLEGEEQKDPKILQFIHGWWKKEDFGIQGLSFTGVFSNADLEANRQGFRFFQDLAITLKYVLNQKNKNPNFNINEEIDFDIGSYINRNWNEYNNPGTYSNELAPLVRKAENELGRR